MSAGKFLDYYSCINGNSGEQADAEQAYIQAELKGPETWVYIPLRDAPMAGPTEASALLWYVSEKLFMGIQTAAATGKSTAISFFSRRGSNPLRHGRLVFGTKSTGSC